LRYVIFTSQNLTYGIAVLVYTVDSALFGQTDRHIDPAQFCPNEAKKMGLSELSGYILLVVFVEADSTVYYTSSM